MSYSIGQTIQTINYGELVVIGYTSSKEVTVRFKATGYTTVTTTAQLSVGRVKDRLHPSVVGVGYVGEGKHKTTEKGKMTLPYRTWQRMLERCYCPKQAARGKGAQGVTVCEAWFNFQTFADWFEANSVEGYELYRGDAQEYSPETTGFISPTEARVAARSKDYSFHNPMGELYEITNLTEFCRQHNLNASAMSRVHSGAIKHYKGWTKA